MKTNKPIFELHQCYERKGSTKAIDCEKCGSYEFYVGQGNYFTCVKCIKCGFEESVHEG